MYFWNTTTSLRIHLILDTIADINPAIITVTGRPRTPRDQGSVERGNKTIKSVLFDVLSERTKEGRNNSWVMHLGVTMACINGHKSRQSTSVSSYTSVFGCPYHRPIKSSLSEAQGAKTVKELLPLLQDEDGVFAEFVANKYGNDVSSPSDQTTDRKRNDAYWDVNDDVLDKPLMNCGDDDEADEGEEGEDFLTAMMEEKELLQQRQVAKEEQELWEETIVAGLLKTPNDDTEEMDETPAAPKDETEMEGYGLKMPATDTNQHAATSISLLTKELFPPSNEDVSITYRKLIPFASASWNDKSVVKSVNKTWGEITYSFKLQYPRLYCKECGLDRYICVYDDTFIDVHSKGDIWYDTEFINVFSFLVCHGSHTLKTTLAPKKSPRLVVVVFPQHSWSTAKINVMQEPLPDKMVLLLWEKSHYAVMEVIVSSRSMNIYDGLNKSLSAWYPHAEYILKMMGIIKAPFQSPAVQFLSLPMSSTIELGGGQPNWHISAEVFITQHDGHNCGPIACLKMLEVFHMTTLKKLRDDLKTMTYRQIVMAKYKELITALQDHLHISQKVRLDDSAKTVYHLCLCNTFEHINDQAFQFMNCCGYTIHKPCVSKFLHDWMWCPTCKSDATETMASMDLSLLAETKRRFDTVREESAKKKKTHQINQGEKMMLRHSKSLKEAAEEVTIGSVVTIWVDRRVATHPRGVVAIVVDKKLTGGIIACSSAGIIVNGKTRRTWYIPSDQYALQSSADSLTTLPPDLLVVQQDVKENLFNIKTHRTCTISEAHQASVGASSPCKRTTCSCKGGRCNASCGCTRGKRGCNSGCSCNGNCSNPHNKLG